MGDYDDEDNDASQFEGKLESNGDEVVIPVSEDLLRAAGISPGDEIEVEAHATTEEIRIQKPD